MRKIIPIFSILLLFLSCNKKNQAEQTSFKKGSLTILTDDSFKSIVEALADAYMINYPETDVKVVVKKEDLAFLDLINGKSSLIAMSKPLSAKEIYAYEQKVDLKYRPDYFAADAVIFIVPKNSNRISISIEEIKNEMLSDQKNLIFDGNNSSNLNFIASKLGKEPSELKYSVLTGNQEVIEELNKFPNKIGVIGLNTISRPYSKEAEKLNSMVKILPVVKDGKSYMPQYPNLANMKYPFTRTIYFLNNEGGFGMAHGIIRFSCTQLGQLVVEKEGLQPYNLYKREVQMR